MGEGEGGLSLALVRVRSRQQHSDNFDWRIRTRTRGSSHLGFTERNLGEIEKKLFSSPSVKDTKAIVGHGHVMPYKLQMIAHKLF